MQCKKWEESIPHLSVDLLSAIGIERMQVVSPDSSQMLKYFTSKGGS